MYLFVVMILWLMCNYSNSQFCILLQIMNNTFLEYITQFLYLKVHWTRKKTDDSIINIKE